MLFRSSAHIRMTLPQTLSILTLVGMMALFIWGRFRYDVTAILALMAALALGIVKPEDAFTGFSDDIVIIVGSALVISAAVQRSGLIEEALALVMRRVTRVRRSEEHTSELQSLMRSSYAVFCLK